MKNEERLLISVCKSYFSREVLVLPNNIDWNAFYRLARHHNLLAICHCVFSDNEALEIPKEERARYLDKFYDIIYRFEMQSLALNEIRDCFENAGIRYVPFKGAVLRNIYPVPESRVMGDIDLLVQKEDRDSARAELEKIGFECLAPNGEVREYCRGNVRLEVHTSMISELGDKAFSDAFENSAFSTVEGRLDDTYHFAYLIAHLAHHFRLYGAGIKLILDLAFMLSKCDVDIDRVLDILKNIKLDAFAREIISVTYHIFGVGREYNPDTEKTENYLLKRGAFGSLEENKGIVIARRNLEKGRSISPLAVKLRLAMPSYEHMRRLPYINFLDGRPWLVPYAWCYRLVYNMKNRTAFMKKAVDGIDENAGALAVQELEYFEEIGLI